MKQSRAERALAICGLLIAALTCLITLRILYLCFNPVPWGDTWDYWAWFRAHENNFIWHLAALHNEHRILTARLFFLFDQFAAGGTQLSLAIFIPAIQFAHALALWRLNLRVPGLSNYTVWFLGALALATMFSSQQFTNFTWYFQIQFVLVYFGATLCSLLLLNAARHKIWMVLTIAAALLTTYSMANGLLVWPLLLSLSFFLRLPGRSRLLFLVFGIGTFFAYFVGYQRPPGHPSPLAAVEHMSAVLRFFVTIIGSPFADVAGAIAKGNPQAIEAAATFVGIFGLLTGLVFIYRALRNKSQSPAELVYVHLLIFAICSIALIASGRFTFPLKEALTSRYTTPALLFWLFLVSLGVFRLDRAQMGKDIWAAKALQIVTLVCFILFLSCDQPVKAVYARGYQGYLSEAEMAISNNVFDQPMWVRVNHDIPTVLSLVDYLRPRHLSIFHRASQSWLGSKIADHLPIVGQTLCQGAIDRIVPVRTSERPGYRVEGWNWASGQRSVPRKLILTDDKNRVIGSGVSGWPRPDVAKSLHRKGALYSGWVGYVSGLDHRKIGAYQLQVLGACEIAQRAIPTQP